MKIYIGDYHNHVHFGFFERVYRKRHPDEWPFTETMDWLDTIILKFQEFCQFVADRTINVLLKKYPLPNEYIKIDPHDMDNLDVTLAKIIHASLVEFQKIDRGIPANDMTQDVDQIIKLSNMIGSIDDEAVNPLTETDDYQLRVKQWKIILDEIIWSFKQIIIGEWEWSANYLDNNNLVDQHRQRMMNGMSLFVKYYCSLWV